MQAVLVATQQIREVFLATWDHPLGMWAAEAAAPDDLLPSTLIGRWIARSL